MDILNSLYMGNYNDPYSILIAFAPRLPRDILCIVMVGMFQMGPLYNFHHLVNQAGILGTLQMQDIIR